MFFGKKKKASQAADLAAQQKELDRQRRLAESQRALMNAALTTADTAQEVTNKLRSRLDDIVNQFDATTRLLKDSLVICNILGEITAFNPAAEKMFDIPHDEAIGKKVTDLFKTANGQPVSDLATLWILFKNDDQSDVVGLRNGASFPIQTNLSILERHDGSTAILLLVQDQTEPQALKRTKSHYDLMLAMSFDGVLVIHRGRIVAANPAACRLFGYRAETMLKEPVSMLVQARDTERLSMSRLLPNGIASPPQQFLLEGIHSSHRPLNLMFASTPIEWDDGSAVLLTIKDVTEFQRLESVLGVRRTGDEMIVCFDASQKITFANKLFANEHGVEALEMLGKGIEEYLSSDEMSVFEANMEKLTPDNPSTRSHTKHYRTNGSVFFQDWIDNAVFDSSGQAVEFQRVGRIIGDALSEAIREL